MKIGLLIAVLCLAAGQLATATEYPKPCVSSYVILRSSLEYSDVSSVYAESLYRGVREILAGYLASPPSERCLFFDSGERMDLEGRPSDSVLDFHCSVKRYDHRVLLSVTIDVFDSRENLLSFEVSAPFFQPSAALHWFAVSFPEEFAGRVAQEYTYPLFDQGFLSEGTLVLGGVVAYRSLDALQQDLGGIGEVPADIVRSVKRHEARESVEGAALILGCLAFIVGDAAVIIYGGGPGGTTGLRTPENVPAWAGAALLGGLATMAVVGIENLIFPPSYPVASLNAMCCGEAPEETAR